MVWQTNIVYAAISEHSLKKNKAVKGEKKQQQKNISSEAQQEMQQCGGKKEKFFSLFKKKTCNHLKLFYQCSNLASNAVP